MTSVGPLPKQENAKDYERHSLRKQQEKTSIRVAKRIIIYWG